MEKNNKNKKYTPIDFSQFPLQKEEKPVSVSPKPFSLGSLKRLWKGMNKKNRIYTIIFGICFLIIIILISLTLKIGDEEKQKVSPSLYTPPTGEEWEEYTPPFP